MSHVDDGTLHAYLDGELSPTEAQGVEAHLAQCPGCRGRLEEERALITRAGELLALAAPPDRALPPFRAGDVKPPPRLWWQVRQPLAWAATVVLALGIGTYLGNGLEQLPKSDTARDAARDAGHVLQAPVVRQRTEQESRAQPRRPTRPAPTVPPPAPAPAARNEAGNVARDASPSLDGERFARQGPPISVDTARALLGADPLVVPGAPVRAIYRAREIGYSGVVIVEQALDSSTVIEVVNGRRYPLRLDQVVVTGAPAARPESVRAAEGALGGRARSADSLAPLRRYSGPQRVSAKATDRPGSDLLGYVQGPLSPDSLTALRRLLRPLRP